MSNAPVFYFLQIFISKEKQMKKEQLHSLIREEVRKTLVEYEISGIQDTTVSPLIKQKIAQFVKTIEGNKSLTRIKIAAILNEIITALGLDKREITLYMNMIKQQQMQNLQKEKMAKALAKSSKK